MFRELKELNTKIQTIKSIKNLTHIQVSKDEVQ